MLYVADFKDGTKGKVEASGYRGALQLFDLKYHKLTLRVRRGGLLDLAYRTPGQFTVEEQSCASTTHGVMLKELTRAA